MQLSNLKPGQPKKARKRRGQGNGSGNGTFAGRGCNGQNARAGGGVRPGFEGGQTSLIQRMPKLPGFRNPNRVETQPVQLSSLVSAMPQGGDVTPVTLTEAGLVEARNAKIKILLDDTTPTAAYVLKGVMASKTARAAIEKAGGSVA